MSPDQTVKAHIENFLKIKKANSTANLVTAGRVDKLRLQLGDFQNWISSETPVTDINGQSLVDYRARLLKKVDEGNWSGTTASERMGTVRTFVRWLWETDAIPTLPRVLKSKSKSLEIGKSQSQIVVFTIEEIGQILRGGSDRTKLYVLLMLNCGMTQKDIADLLHSEVDWADGRITRKRSKTSQHKNVPKVSYHLWPETLLLLRQERSTYKSDRVLLNQNGKPLWYEELSEDGKYKKTDNVRTAFERLRKKLKIGKPLKSLKKTSASLIRGNKKYAGLEDLFLGHAPTKMSDRHYAQPPEESLKEAVNWLRDQYNISGCVPVND